jgi:hypothetical protein
VSACVSGGPYRSGSQYAESDLWMRIAMTNFNEKLSNLLQTILARPLPSPSFFRIPSENCQPLPSGGTEICSERDYFKIIVNRLGLSEGGRLWADFDPVLFILVDFIHGSEKVSQPFVVGPSLIRKGLGAMPHGLVLKDTLVSGPYPFRGGRIAITIVL